VINTEPDRIRYPFYNVTFQNEKIRYFKGRLFFKPEMISAILINDLKLLIIYTGRIPKY